MGETVQKPTVPEQAGPPAAESAAATREPLLEVDHVTLRFGGVVALNDVDFTLYKGEILGLIGPNGAGKTTCFNAMTGIYQPTEGEIRFRGERITGKKRHQITKMGMARTFQNIRLFPEMTALENIQVGADAHHKTSVISALFRLPRHWREERDGLEKARAAAGLRRHLRSDARVPRATCPTASSADWRSPGRWPPTRCCSAWTSRPPASTRRRRRSCSSSSARSGTRAITVLLIEHDMRLVMGVTDRIVVLEFGKKIAEGLPAEVREDHRR